jgi:hypothetical protein
VRGWAVRLAYLSMEGGERGVMRLWREGSTTSGLAGLPTEEESMVRLGSGGRGGLRDSPAKGGAARLTGVVEGMEENRAARRRGRKWAVQLARCSAMDVVIETREMIDNATEFKGLWFRTETRV